MSNQRNEERRKVMTFTPVYNLDTNTLLGYLRDLTLKGASVAGEKSIEIDQKLSLAIEFSETSETPATRMKIPARVAWCRHDENTTNYETGLEFLEMNEPNKKVIEAILEKYRFSRKPPS